MSLQAADFDCARRTCLNADSVEKMLDALGAVARLEALFLAQSRNDAWAKGMRGDGVAKAEGFTETHTGILRRLAAKGEVTHQEIGPELPRHISEIRRRLKSRNSSIQIDTLVGVGYRLSAGLDELLNMLRGHASITIRAPGYTEKETTILSLLHRHGSLHVDQVKTLQRYISKLRAKLPKSVQIETHAGQGLYTVDEDSRKRIGEVLAGESAPAAPPPAKSVIQALHEELMAEWDKAWPDVFNALTIHGVAAARISGTDLQITIVQPEDFNVQWEPK